MKLPPSNLRAGYYVNNDDAYITSGIRDWERIQKTLFELPISSGVILDFGGSSGRLARHMPGSCQVMLCDKKTNSVNWVNTNTDILAFVNEQGIPLPDNSVDLVTALSVFTHITNDTYWLLEIKRVLKPGGHLYATVHGDRVWQMLHRSNYPYLYNQIAWGSNTSLFIPKDKPLILPSSKQNNNAIFVFHSWHYIKTVWAKIMAVREPIEGNHPYQTAIVMRKV